LCLLFSRGICIVHDWYFGAYAGMVTYLVVFCSILIGFLRHDVLRRREVVKARREEAEVVISAKT
jgi:hypothetical protein